MPVNRYDRIGEELKKAISEVVREMKDPRISLITTIMSAEVTSDLDRAKVRVSVLGERPEDGQATVDALNHASGFIAREVGRRIEIRKVPRLKFVLDNSIEYSAYISGLIDKLNQKKNDDDEN